MLPAKPTANPFEAYGDATNSRHIIGTLLKFSKGDYLAGQSSEDIPLGTVMTAIMDHLMVGWVQWCDNAPTQHVMGRVVEGYVPPRRAELGDMDQSQWERDDRGDPKDPWQLTNYLPMVGQDETYTFTTSSKGGIGAIGELCKVYGRHMRERPEEYPRIKLEVGSYMHSDKQFGRIRFPVFKVNGCANKAPLLKEIEGGETQGQITEDVPFYCAPSGPAGTCSTVRRVRANPAGCLGGLRRCDSGVSSRPAD
jgi:hypothetical protein